VIAGVADSGISLRWYRRTAATVIARAVGTDAAATFLGTHLDRDHRRPLLRTRPHGRLDRTLRPHRPDGSLLEVCAASGENALHDAVESELDDDVVM
jgi:hypothetical protein